VYWLRLVSAPMHYVRDTFVNPLGEKVPNLQMHVVSFPPAAAELKPWKEVIQNLYPESADSTHIIKSILEDYGNTAKPNIISDPDYKFRGAVHCEAALASLHYLANYGKNSEKACTGDCSFSRLNRISLPVLRPRSRWTCSTISSQPRLWLLRQKKCCPVCAFIQRQLSAACGRRHNYPVYRRHVYVYACALPPGLIPQVRREAIKYFEELLRPCIEEVRIRSLSGESAESAPCSPALSGKKPVRIHYLPYDLD